MNWNGIDWEKKSLTREIALTFKLNMFDASSKHNNDDDDDGDDYDYVEQQWDLNDLKSGIRK